ncbi:MAG TPA: sigma-70 family RNA polymerase sigma factor [Acidimicrobiales bacterium]|nr:sigma-70 family RNA polymerase sigma factor [Acidimicrobiales bacterium]
MRRIGLPVDQLPDETLLAGCSNGDDELTVAFVRRFQARMYGVALAVTGDPGAAEDVAQQAFERAWRHGHTYDPRRGSVTTWLAAVTRNLAIDATRVRRPAPVDAETLLARVVAVGDGPEQSALVGESVSELRAALRRLPAEQARALVLSGIAGLSASQVAACEGIPLGTAKTRIRTGMHRLRAALVGSEADRD